MTVNYNQDVATERIGGFFRLLFRWRGSIYQAVYGEIGIFLLLYSFLSLLYRLTLNEPSRTTFERICLYCGQFLDFIPVTFILGFYLVRVLVRRWSQWENMPWPDRFSLDISAYLNGCDVKSRLLRRTLVRYANLASVMCIRDICVPVRKRFPSLDHLVVAGFLTTEEVDLFNKTSSIRDSNWWIPFQWAYTLISRAYKEGKLTEGSVMRLHDGVLDLRHKCWVLFCHDWVPIPMVYTQVCTLSVYLYMLASLFGRQYLDPLKKYPNHDTDLYIPYFTIFQLVFYLGWLKVSEILINPMGYDADDFDMNYIIDRNVRVAYTMVDDNYNKMPPVEKDIFWGIEEPELPHTEGSKGIRDTPFVGSAINVKISDNECQLAQTEFTSQNQLVTTNGELHKSPSDVDKDKVQTPNLLKRLISRAISQTDQEVDKGGNLENSRPRKCSRVTSLESVNEGNEQLVDLIPTDSEGPTEDLIVVLDHQGQNGRCVLERRSSSVEAVHDSNANLV